MDDVSELRRREVETYFEVIARGGTDRLLQARSFHNLGEWTHQDYEWLCAVLSEANATSSFSFLGRDAERYAQTIAMLADAGHEIVLHGHRHVECETISYDLAHENVSRGLDAIDDAAGIVPEGFIAPRQAINGATLRVLDEFDFRWVLGRTDAEVSPSIKFAEPAHPYDLIILNEGANPTETFAQLRTQSVTSQPLLFHPNMLEYYDALDDYRDWIHDVQPVAITDYFDSDRTGLINDAMRPLRII